MILILEFRLNFLRIQRSFNGGEGANLMGKGRFIDMHSPQALSALVKILPHTYIIFLYKIYLYNYYVEIICTFIIMQIYCIHKLFWIG